MPREEWITIAEFAAEASLPIRTARYHAQRAAKGKPTAIWPIRVRKARGRGGKSGTCYEVALSSLPEALQDALSGPLDEYLPVIAEPHSVPERRVPAANQTATIARRWRIIEEAALLPPRSAERAVAIQRAADRHGESVRNIQRWISQLEQYGGDVNALARKKPERAHDRRVWVSRPFDQAFLAAGYAAELLPELSDIVDQFCRKVWASPRQRSGWRWVGRDIVTLLEIECRERGYQLPKAAFYLSKRRILELEHFRRVDIYKHDRKRFDDEKPRIRRDNSKLAPMQQVCMDVKPIDIVFNRPDGSEVYPKMIGFMDVGTHRIFTHFVLLPRGCGITQEHVTEAFLRMVSHPEWGFPEQIYRDNGSEFFHFDKIQSALEMAASEAVGRRTIINAKPYSGASKPIESKFAVLDKYVFNQFPGWVGGNRMNKKTQTVGKKTKPYPRDFESFIAEANDRIVDFESVAILTGPFAGRSPTQIYMDHVDAGWRPVSVHQGALDAAFCERVTRNVQRGFVSINSTRFRHPELDGLNGRRVVIALPWRRNAWPLVDLPEFGWAYLEPEMLHLPGDIAGAIDAGRMQQRDARNVYQLHRAAGTVARDGLIADRITKLPTRAAPAPMLDLLMSEEAESFADGRTAAGVARLAVPDAAERRRRRLEMETEDLEAYLASKRS